MYCHSTAIRLTVNVQLIRIQFINNAKLVILLISVMQLSAIVKLIQLKDLMPCIICITFIPFLSNITFTKKYYMSFPTEDKNGGKCCNRNLKMFFFSRD